MVQPEEEQPKDIDTDKPSEFASSSSESEEDQEEEDPFQQNLARLEYQQRWDNMLFESESTKQNVNEMLGVFVHLKVQNHKSKKKLIEEVDMARARLKNQQELCEIEVRIEALSRATKCRSQCQDKRLPLL